MLCQRCHKNLANGRYAEVVDGKVTEVPLCSECLAQYQEKPAGGFELAGSVSPNRSGGVSRYARTRPKIQRACPACGMRLTRVLDAGVVGCTTCYRTFEEVTTPLLHEIHGDLRHLGKAPKVDDSRVQLRADLQNRRALMRSAVEMESYEEAAVLRDEIRKLESALAAAEAKQE